MEKELSFTERTALMREMAQDLKAIAADVLAEAQRMEAAQSRFAERGKKRSGAQRRVQS